MTTKTDDRVFMVVDRNGMPMYGTKICSNRGSATQSMTPHLNGIIYDKIGCDNPMADIHRQAQEGYGLPKPVHDREIDDLVDKMRNTSCWPHKAGNKAITRTLVEDYNDLIREVTDNWRVAEVGLKSPYKVLEIDLCDECNGWYDVRGFKNQSQILCRNCRRP
jgi:hypothetical protein